jgi:hypothetical protein
VGVLQRFERRLGGMVEGVFARAFKSEVQPVEVAAALQRELDDRAAVVGRDRTLVPNHFVVELGDEKKKALRAIINEGFLAGFRMVMIGAAALALAAAACGAALPSKRLDPGRPRI